MGENLKRAAVGAATAVAPELAVPAEVAAELWGRHAGPAPPSTGGASAAVVAPPPPLITLRPMRVRRRRGVVIVEPAQGLTAADALALAAGGVLVGTAYVGYEVWQAWKKSGGGPLGKNPWAGLVGMADLLSGRVP